ncbi:hypothetical protein JCM10212_000505 [Sporobolomyces blumeae]
MAQPVTPTRPRTVQASSSPTKPSGPRLVPLDPSKPALRSTSVATLVNPFTKSRTPAPTEDVRTSTIPRLDSTWVIQDGVNLIVSATMHERKLSRECSWLHMFEHARYLHAGLPQAAVVWPSYPTRTSDDTPLLRNIHTYLSSLSPKKELLAAFKQGTIHFSGELGISKDPRDGQKRVSFKLCPPSTEMSSALYRKWGSDRFLRIKLDDDLLRAAGPSFDRPPTSDAPGSNPKSAASSPPSLRAQLKLFFSSPLSIFGRRYAPFCTKDGAVVYFCESGTGIEAKDEATLVQFAQAYLDVRLNPGMSVAKYCARFELGLTTTTPTVTFPRHRVLRTPDLKSDSLKISIAMMQHVRDAFCKTLPNASKEFLPTGYLPSCIRGLYGTTNDDKVMTPAVWQLDYTSPDSPSSRFVHARPLSPDPSQPARIHFKFSISMKDGRESSVWLRVMADKVKWDEPWGSERRANVDMTDGCSLMSYSAMVLLADKYSEARGDHELRPSIPPVAQGRLGPGKGVWAVAPDSAWETSDPRDRWIEVRDSQWKFEDRQTDSFNFELHSVPNAKGSARLGKQMFEVLSHCGVPPSAFREMLRSQVTTSQNAFWNPSSAAALLYHVEKSCGIMEDRTLKAKLATDRSNLKLNAFDSNRVEDDANEAGAGQAVKHEEGEGFVHDNRLDPFSAAPNTVPEVVVQMLQAGFEPRKSPHLAAKLKITAGMALEKQLGFKVDDDYSRTAFVIADHLGVLQ